MITLSHEQLEKINLIDKLFASIGIDQLKQLVESEQIVSRLKGTEDNPQLLLTLIHERDILITDNIRNKNDILALKTDFQTLVKVLQTDVFTPRYNQDFNNLKSKHGVY